MAFSEYIRFNYPTKVLQLKGFPAFTVQVVHNSVWSHCKCMAAASSSFFSTETPVVQPSWQVCRLSDLLLPLPVRYIFYLPKTVYFFVLPFFPVFLLPTFLVTVHNFESICVIYIFFFKGHSSIRGLFHNVLTFIFHF